MLPATSASRPVAQNCGNPAECSKEDRPLFKVIRDELDFGTALFSEFGQFIDDIDLLFQNDRCTAFRT